MALNYSLIERKDFRQNRIQSQDDEIRERMILTERWAKIKQIPGAKCGICSKGNHKKQCNGKIHCSVKGKFVNPLSLDHCFIS